MSSPRVGSHIQTIDEKGHSVYHGEVIGIGPGGFIMVWWGSGHVRTYPPACFEPDGDDIFVFSGKVPIKKM